ncbi:MAG: carbon-nitrogen family hydrolase [Desulfobacteraceae bacterium]|nr:MAG: carbon-nitrogen family hydrolase [Desulfobacteraceae bacterium]
MKNPETLRAGVIQFDVKRGDIPSNFQSATDAIGRLKDQGAHMAVLPELWTCGFDNKNIVRHAEKTPEIIEMLTRTAKIHGMLIAGSVPEISDGLVYNTLFVIDADGTVSGRYRKVHLFSASGENQTFAAGQRAEVWDTSLGPVGAMICYDIRFPELCRSLAIQGARIVVVCAQWPEARISHWDTLLQARAIENQLFIVASNRTGRDTSLNFPGHSQIISPFGEILAKTVNTRDEVSSEINFKDIDTFRNHFNCITERVPEAYRF